MATAEPVPLCFSRLRPSASERSSECGRAITDDGCAQKRKKRTPHKAPRMRGSTITRASGWAGVENALQTSHEERLRGGEEAAGAVTLRGGEQIGAASKPVRILCPGLAISEKNKVRYDLDQKESFSSGQSRRYVFLLNFIHCHIVSPRMRACEFLGGPTASNVLSRFLRFRMDFVAVLTPYRNKSLCQIGQIPARIDQFDTKICRVWATLGAQHPPKIHRTVRGRAKVLCMVHQAQRCTSAFDGKLPWSSY